MLVGALWCLHLETTFRAIANCERCHSLCHFVHPCLALTTPCWHPLQVEEVDVELYDAFQSSSDQHGSLEGCLDKPLAGSPRQRVGVLAGLRGRSI